MEITQAVQSLSALAQESRLTAFRLLVIAGRPGMAAGDIAESLGVPHNTLSTHLAVLNRAGLLQSRREGRKIFYAVDFDGTRSLLRFLLQDCCRGAADVCAPAVDAVLESSGTNTRNVEVSAP